ncbi:MAG: ABC transporter ATP-binding protein [Proteobacteria bacterium]|nr:ABC transporter ATP-binding protein [Pseudomonadota bacterium]MBU4384220.1 ABC transporter ATP-binding protein [Pseudomonadota bacterium]MBU4606575.1 ABC transporter ATP-binding protein [Pseudomonadota bacterium]MCG2766679.1 ABC transporter ATP-binding protein [Desulfarculaceae bacterium]
MAEPILSLTKVHTYIEQHHILQGVDLSFMPGRATVLLGRNGAGKSTTLRTVMGLTPASSGDIVLKGRAVQAMKPYEVAKQGVGFVPEDQAVLYTLSVEENFRLAMLNENETTWARMETIFQLFPDMKKFWRSKAGVLSGGQKQMLAIARAFVNDHDLLLIDEPSKGLAPIVVDHLIESINHIKNHTTVILVEQNFYMASHIGVDYFILDDGRTVHQGLMADLVHDEGLKQKYLGIA